MNSVQSHYDELLGPVYSWILGDFAAAYQANVELFDRLQVTARPNGLAIDLGSGPGCQSIPLAERGFRVVAIDFCRHLLDELEERAGQLPVTAVCDDLLRFGEHVSDPADLIVCMGDTLVHLPDPASVEALVGKLPGALSPGGAFVASLRDYTGPVPTGAERFIPLRSSKDRIFTCFLEHAGDIIRVHDILQVRENGEWRLRISSYVKLRLDYRWLIGRLEDCGLAVDDAVVDGDMVVIRATRPR